MVKCLQEYMATIEKVQDLLDKNSEWRCRYAEYIGKLGDITEKLKKAKRAFRLPAQLCLYMKYTMAKENSTRDDSVFELRFRGLSVAEVTVHADGRVTFCVTNPMTQAGKGSMLRREMVRRGRTGDAAVLASYAGQVFDWRAKQGSTFRRIFRDLDADMGNDAIPYKKEHYMESTLLGNYAQSSSVGKEVIYLQPVMMAGTSARFQMPTPIGASHIVKKGISSISYGGDGGGGIDILARAGSSGRRKLAVLELKDKHDKDEPPEKAICQAIAYAAFLRELLRSDCGKAWYEFFGLGGGVPAQLTIKAVIVMPNEPDQKERPLDRSFGGYKLPVEPQSFKAVRAAAQKCGLILGEDIDCSTWNKLVDEAGGDIIELDYIYREKNGQPSKTTSDDGRIA